MKSYCAYCNSRIYDSDRICPQCGAGLKNTVEKVDIASESMDEYHYLARPRIMGTPSDLLPFSDIRLGCRGDSFCFDVNTRDVFVTIDEIREYKYKCGVTKQFNGFINLSPCNKGISQDEISSCISTLINALRENNGSEIKTEGFSQDNFVQLYEKIGAFNGGNRPVVVGDWVSFSSVLPVDKNYEYKIGDGLKLAYVKNFVGIDGIIIPPPTSDFLRPIPSYTLFIISPTNGKLLKIASDSEYFTNVALGAAAHSVIGRITVQ